MRVISALVIFFILQVFASPNFWKEGEGLNSNTLTKRSGDDQTTPRRFHWVLPTENHASLTQFLNEIHREEKTRSVSLPFPTGEVKSFQIEFLDFLAPHVQSQFPHLKYFHGHGSDGDYVRFSWNEETNRFHGLIKEFSTGEVIRILHKEEMIVKESELLAANDFYRSFYYSFSESLNELPEGERLEMKEHMGESPLLERTTPSLMSKRGATDAKSRRYRFAFSSAGEYTNFYASASAAFTALSNFLASMAAIYKADLGIDWQIVSDLRTVYTNGSTDPFTLYNTGANLGENAVLNTVYGSANYDIGHNFGRASGGGSGLACLGCVCRNSKYSATSTTSNPNFGFWLSLASHEVGHQFDMGHTFNGVSSNCNAGNFMQSSAVEPGSGSTIMSYCGSCGSDNIQSNTDVYFHHFSLMETHSFILSLGTCGNPTVATNAAPVVVISSPANVTIPRGTPFVLRGSATDANGDPITFVWEQVDVSAGQVPLGTAPSFGPLFRSFPPTTAGNVRFIPRMTDQRAGLVSTNAELTAPPPRRLRFALTARDAKGAIGYEYYSFNVADLAPFSVTSHNAPLNVTGCGYTTLTWNVGGSLSCAANIKVMLSIDNGATWSYVLAQSTPNDGSESIQVPNVNTTQAWLLLEAVESIFMGVNTRAFRIIADPTTSCNSLVPQDVTVTTATEEAVTGKKGGSKTGIIAGVIVGLILLLLIVGAIVAFFLWKRRKSSSSYSSHSQDVKLAPISSPSPVSSPAPVPAPAVTSPAPVKKPLPPSPQGFKVGDKVLAQYSADNQFYNAFIDQVNNGNYLVRYYEFGNSTEWLPANKIKNP